MIPPMTRVAQYSTLSTLQPRGGQRIVWSNSKHGYKIAGSGSFRNRAANWLTETFRSGKVREQNIATAIRVMADFKAAQKLAGREPSDAEMHELTAAIASGDAVTLEKLSRWGVAVTAMPFSTQAKKTFYSLVHHAAGHERIDCNGSSLDKKTLQDITRNDFMVNGRPIVTRGKLLCGEAAINKTDLQAVGDWLEREYSAAFGKEFVGVLTDAVNQNTFVPIMEMTQAIPLQTIEGERFRFNGFSQKATLAIEMSSNNDGGVHVKCVAVDTPTHTTNDSFVDFRYDFDIQKYENGKFVVSDISNLHLQWRLQVTDDGKEIMKAIAAADDATVRGARV